MSDSPDHVPYVGVDDLTEADWAMVHANFLTGAKELDFLVDACKQHIETAQGGCSGPWCAPPQMIEKMEQYTGHQLALLLHQAVYRLGLQEAQVNFSGEAS